MKVKFNIKRYFQVLGITLGIMFVGAFVCLGINYSGIGDGNTVVDNTSTVEVYGGKINVLLMCTDIDGLRTDAIMLASYDTKEKKVNILSIPRDTKMYVGNRYQKINAAHAFMKDGVIGGPTATCEAVNRITGIPINYYIDFSFDAVAKVVDQLGTIDFTIPDLYGDGVGMVYDDPVQGLHIDLPPGDYKLNGQQVVWVMRYRHGNVDPRTGTFKGYPNGDEGRMEMQQKLIKAIVDQKLNASLVLKMPAIFQAISENIKTNFTVKDVVKYSKYLIDFKSENIINHQLPGSYGHDGNIGDVWEVNIAKTKELVNTVFGYDASNITVENPVNRTSSSTTSVSSASTSASSGTTSASSSENTSSTSTTYDDGNSTPSWKATGKGSSSGSSSSSSSSSDSSSTSSSSSSSSSTNSSSSSSSSTNSSSSGSSGVVSKNLEDE